jgi:hypothetical protein
VRAVAVDILVPNRLRRWVLPLGFLGLAGIMAIMMALPAPAGATFFGIARIGFVVAYFALFAVGFSRKRRTTTVYVDLDGLREAGALLVARASIDRVLSSRTNQRTTIEIRGRTPLALEVTSATDADALLATLDPGRDTATASFLATTTPTFLVVTAWMGIPGVLSLPAQVLLAEHAGTAALIAYAIPCGVIWLGASWWFGRRRRVTLSTTEIMLPRLFSPRAQTISLGELTTVALRDAFTVELRFSSRRPRKLKIYDPALRAELVDRLKERSRATVLDLKR